MDVTKDVGADMAELGIARPLILVRKGNLVFDLGFPPNPRAKDQLVALAKLVLARAADAEKK